MIRAGYPVIVIVLLSAILIPTSLGKNDENGMQVISSGQYGKGYRYNIQGWVYIHIEGGPYERGYQYGYLASSEIVDMIKEGLECFSDEYELTGAGSGKECFEILKTGEKPDLILLDIMMPKMNGWEVFAKLKENPGWRGIPIVFLTAKTDPYSKGFGKIASDDYIEKPFGIKDLKKRIDRILNK